MGSEIDSPTYGQLLIAHDERLSVWEAQTNATSAGVQPGRLLSLTSAMALACAGAPDMTDGNQVVCLRSGYSAAGATMGYYDQNDNLIGWDAPTALAYVEPLDWSTRSSTDDNLITAAATSENEVVMASQYDGTSGQTSVRIRVRDVDGAWSSPTTLATDYGTSGTMRPIVTAYSDRVRMYMWRRFDSGGSPNMYLSAWEASALDDLTDADSWSEIARDGLVIYGYSTAPGRMQVAHGGGQWMIVYGQGANLIQLASRDGLSWTTIGTATAFHDFTLMYQGGAFVLVYADSSGVLNSRSVGSAFTPLSTATEIEIADYGATTGSALDTFVDDAGTGWVLTGGLGGTTSAEMWATRDGGDSWTGSGQDDIGRIYATGLAVTAQSVIINAAAVWLRDRMLMIHEASPDAVTTSAPAYALAVAHFGRCTSLPRPTTASGWDAIDRTPWPLSWMPTVRIDTSWVTATGTPTDGPDGTLVAMTVVTGAGEAYTVEPTSNNDPVTIARVVGRANSGTMSQYVQASDGTDAVRIRIEQTSTGIAVYDDVAGGAALASALVEGVVDVVSEVRIYGTTWRVWYVVHTVDVPIYGYLTGTTLTTETEAGSCHVWEIEESASYTVHIYQLQNYVGGPQNRDVGRGYADYPDLSAYNGRPVGPLPVYLGEGLYVRASGGLAKFGDLWTYTADALYHYRQWAWTAEYPSPRTRWRSTGTDSEGVAYTYGSDPASLLSPVWGLVFEGTAQRLSISFHDGTSWGSETSLDLGLARTMTRYGSTLIPTASAQTGAYVDEDELAGGFVVDPSGNARRILSNTAGVLGSVTGLTWQKATLTIDDPDATDTGSVSWDVVWPRVAYIFEPSAGTAQGVRVRWGVSSSLRETPEGYHEGKVLIGPAYYLGLKHGTDTSRVTQAQPRTFEADNGVRMTGKAAPTREVVTLSWQNTLDRMKQARGTYIGGPDYGRGWDGSGDPIYTRGGMGPTLRALVSRWSAAGTPVAYVPSYTRAAAEKLLTSSMRGVVVGTLDPTWTIEHVGRQEEQREDVVRLGQLRITELT